MRIELRLLSLLFLSFFAFTTVGEARNTSSIRSAHVQKRQLKTARHKKRQPVHFTAKKKHASSVKQAGKTRQKLKTKNLQKPKIVRKKTQYVSGSKKKSVTQTAKPMRKMGAKESQNRSNVTAKKKQIHKVGSRKKQPIVSKKKIQPKSIQNRKKNFLQKQVAISNKKTDYFSQLNHHTKRNAHIGKLDQLFSKNHFGQGQTVAVIELSGDWNEMRNVISGKEGNLIPAIRENYKRNFLPPTGDPRVDPNARIDRCSLNKPVFSDYHKHGSCVSSVLLDLSPQAKVLPVSTYETPLEQSYDIADALMALSKRSEVSVINMSGGHYDFDIKSEFNQDYKLITTYTFPPKHIEAFKAVVKAGKVVVLAAGNEGIELQTANDSNFHAIEKYRLFLLENLDEETRKSIIFAGNLDPNSSKLHESSTRPGTLKSAQDIFLYAPGEMELSYKPYIYRGTSFSAPYISATIANLCSRSPKITPKHAVRALLETADKQSDARTYGRGIINAARALKMLEREILK